MSVDFTPEQRPYKKIGSFKFFFIQNFPFIADDFDQMTYYELLCKLAEYLKKLKENNDTLVYNQEQVVEAYEELQQYVNSYFDNLDVQQEINNKLDRMAENGTLTQLISDYVNPYIDEQNSRIDSINSKVNSVASGSPAGVYDTVSDLTTADPSHTKIYLVKADGYWYYYDVTNTTWTRGGLYQGTSIAENSVGYPELKEELQDGIILKNLQYYGKYSEIASLATFGLGTQEGNGYYSITRNKAVGYSGKVTKVYIKLTTQGLTGLLRLERLSYNGSVLTKLSQDTYQYPVVYGLNVIELTVPFQINYGEYLGFTITPTTESPYPVGYCNVSVIQNTSSYSYGLLCKKYADDGTLKLNTMIPAFDFELQSNNYISTVGELETLWFNAKSWIAYGDSITAGAYLENHGTEPRNNNDVDTYVKLVANKNNMTFYNYGTSGRGYSNGDVENYKAYKLIQNYNVPGCDIVTVAFGTNDWGTLNEQNNVEFGTPADASTESTFCAYVKKAFNMLLTVYPESIIIIMTPIPRPGLEINNIAGHNLIDYAEAIKTIAKQYGFYVMDCLSIARSNVKSNEWRTAYMVDSVHMNENYHLKYYAPMVEEQFKLARVD